MNKDDKTCSQCSQRNRCGQIYEKMGHSKGPNVTWAVLGAFVVPILVFIGSLVAANQLLQGRLTEKMLTFVSFLAALGVTTAFIVLIWVIRRLIKKG